jgi:predicted alpha-1,6-mannanase (GH76 family)
VILGGLAALYQATKDETYLTEAKQTANAAMTGLVNSNGILMDPCSGTCTGQNPDQTQFKGIFMRNLAALYEVTGDPTYKDFIEKNAASVWENDRNVQDVIGYDWAGPVTGTDQSFNASTLSSGLDVLNAAAAVERRERWGGGSPQR